MIAQSEMLSPSGWVMMIGCITLVCGLCVFCFWRILRERYPSGRHHVPLDIDTRDVQE